MKCHPLRWIWGLIPIAVFSWVAALSVKDGIERDLSQRVSEALNNANLSWAKVRFDGREGTLSGRADEESEPGKALQIGNAVSGVRVLDGQADLLRKVDPYTWSASLADGRVTLAGFVPNQKTHLALLSAAKAQFPKAELVDKLDFARGNPPVVDWLDGVRFGLKQLAALKTGKAELSGLDLSVSGEAGSAAAFKDVKAALWTSLPKTLKLASEKVTAPLVVSYGWLAKLAGNQVIMSGFVPNERARDDLLAHAKQAFGKTAIIDRMEYGEGAPEGWGKAAKVSLDQLATLQEGTAEFNGGVLTLSGLAADDATADSTRKAFKAQVPAPIKTAEAIRGLKQTVSPYTTKIEATATAVDVTGYVPNEAERTVVLAMVKSRLPSHAIRDQLRIAAGEPAGYDTCLMSAVAGLGKLGAGRVVLVDKQVELSGQTEDEAVVQALPGDVRAGAKGACETKVAVTLDDARKRKAAEDAARLVSEKAALEKAAAEKAAADKAAADKAKLDAERNKPIQTLDTTKRDADLAAQAKAEREAADVKRVAIQAAEQQVKVKAASACEGDLRNANNAGYVQFERASDVLLRQSLPTVRKLAQIAIKCENVLIEIEGHTDSEGIPERNQPLSERRAQSVVTFLVDEGVSADRIKAIGYGDTKPIAPNDTAENRAKNRRIEFTVKSK
jgi:OmpA-OmpF porin, OOP family